MAQPGDKIPALRKHNTVAQNQTFFRLPGWIKPALIDRLGASVGGFMFVVWSPQSFEEKFSYGNKSKIKELNICSGIWTKGCIQNKSCSDSWENKVKHHKEGKWRFCRRGSRSLEDKEERWDSDIWTQICTRVFAQWAKLCSETSVSLLFKHKPCTIEALVLSSIMGLGVALRSCPICGGHRWQHLFQLSMNASF